MRILNNIIVVIAGSILSFSAVALDTRAKSIEECDAIGTMATHVMTIRQSGDPRHVAKELLDLRMFQIASYHGDRTEWIDHHAANMVSHAYERPITAVNGAHAKMLGKGFGAAYFEACVDAVRSRKSGD